MKGLSIDYFSLFEFKFAVETPFKNKKEVSSSLF